MRINKHLKESHVLVHFTLTNFITVTIQLLQTNVLCASGDPACQPLEGMPLALRLSTSPLLLAASLLACSKQDVEEGACLGVPWSQAEADSKEARCSLSIILSFLPAWSQGYVAQGELGGQEGQALSPGRSLQWLYCSFWAAVERAPGAAE